MKTVYAIAHYKRPNCRSKKWKLSGPIGYLDTPEDIECWKPTPGVIQHDNCRTIVTAFQNVPDLTTGQQVRELSEKMIVVTPFGIAVFVLDFTEMLNAYAELLARYPDTGKDDPDSKFNRDMRKRFVFHPAVVNPNFKIVSVP